MCCLSGQVQILVIDGKGTILGLMFDLLVKISISREASIAQNEILNCTKKYLRSYRKFDYKKSTSPHKSKHRIIMINIGPINASR